MAIELAKRQLSRNDVLATLDPAVAKWFSSFPDLTPPQRFAIASVSEGRNTLIASPTGSGKTMGAFLAILNELTKHARSGSLEDHVYCVYVSPLRSLNNDIAKNLNEPLAHIDSLLQPELTKGKSVRVAVRTGDTTKSERSKMLTSPPHILVTTPETLAILLVAPRFREHLRFVRWVVVDEIHELCSSKRGVHLSLSLERLQSISQQEFTRIGLSATINPLYEVARYLVGYDDRGVERPCQVVDARFEKPIEISVTSPLGDLVHGSFDWIISKMYERVSNVIENNSTTLIFTNTRSMAERVAFHLSQNSPGSEGRIGAHHGSLSREIRKDVEDRLKKGKMSAVVTSTSLELGLDIGSIDSVFQIGSPKSITRCLQRVGRSGHSLDRTSRAVLFSYDREDLIENATIAKQARLGNLDRIYFPKCSLDVLAQHLVGMAVERKWKVDEAFRVVTRSYCYRKLDIESFDDVLRFLAGKYSPLEEYRVYGRIWFDEKAQTFGKRSWSTRVIYCTNIGTIPEEATVNVFTRKEGKWVGDVEEEFIERLSPGDIFLLGAKTYKFSYARGFKAYVDPVEGKKPTVPIWTSESLPLSFDLGEAVSSFRSEISKMAALKKPEQFILDFIRSEANCDENAASAILSYVRDQISFLKFAGISEPMEPGSVLIENYVDHEVRQNLIFNCIFGRRINDALSRALAQRISERRHGTILVTVSDNGFMLTLPPGIYIQPKFVVEMLALPGIRQSLEISIKRTELLKRKFRHCCARSLMILKNYNGNGVSVQRQQISSQILFSLCERIVGFPILREAYREVMEDVMDVENAEKVVEEIRRGTRRIIVCPRLSFPSPYSHNLIVKGSTDVVQMAERREVLQTLYDSVMAKVNLANSQHSHEEPGLGVVEEEDGLAMKARDEAA